MAEAPFTLEAADAGRLWIHDTIHCPRALPPLCAAVWCAISATGALGMDSKAFNGFVFMSPRGMPGAAPAAAEQLEGTARWRWEQRYLPKVRAAYESLRGRDYASATSAELVSFFQAELGPVCKAFNLTLESAVELGPDADRLSDFLEKRLGPDGGLLAATILHGADTETASLGRDVRRLADAAEQTPTVKAMSAAGDFEGMRDCQDDPWHAELARFLGEHADEIALWSEVHEPPWSEDPLPLMRLVRATVGAARRSSSQASGRAEEEARTRLNSEDIAEFEAALALSKDYVPVIEDRARWQLKLMGALRLPLAALGRRLMESGGLAAAGDVFFLELEELASAAAGTLDARALVAGRRREWERNRALEAPQTMGLPVSWEMVGSFSSMARRMFGAAAIQAPTSTVVGGIGASRGVATGRARIVRSLDEAEGLEDGDILVCPSTSPPWTPYLAVVSALVTNSGGVLCHAAIEAREYGIPAVVGTLRATELIPDGAKVTVDGTAGTITIL